MSANSVTASQPLRIERAQFLEAFHGALQNGRGYAAGKIGNTERAVLLYPLVRERFETPMQMRAYELTLANHVLRHSGVFPTDHEFLERFSREYAQAVTMLDCVGLWPDRLVEDIELVARHGFRGHAIPFIDQEPDRSFPSDDSRCYLPFLRGRHVLIVCPFAGLLRERATRETFEAVWIKTGKPWFGPASVQALELPYGYSPATWNRYPTALDLFADVRGRMETMEYDAALIGAGLLGSMLAVAAKERGRVAISLGGHLQIVFGVNGPRWRDRVNWRRKYFNEAWIDLPESSKPGAGESDENYW
jgi:hypothetical protein